MQTLELLVLPDRDNLIRIFDLSNYFRQPGKNVYSDLLTDINSADAFGVHYAAQSSIMQTTLQAIRKQAEIDKHEIKTIEVQSEENIYNADGNNTHHYSCPSIALTSVEDFCSENGFKVGISSIQPTKFDDEKHFLTPQLDYPNYKHTYNSFSGVPNSSRIMSLPKYLVGHQNSNQHNSLKLVPFD
ncbi:unnamed protein product [Adineta ricciae]|uniref:Uncharacterized protein n=1 Tax=Adineta ricciae TaxID=249248 RepID=A0A815R009_ADIRI|nr:unnamed protein product [Adineta ricciae]CAF1625092.1 unnamed protein product [Adineta ricciae]